MRKKQMTTVRFYDTEGKLTRTDKFEIQSHAGLWLSLNGYTTKGAPRGEYRGPDGYAKVDYKP